MSRIPSRALPPVRVDVGNEWAWCGDRRLQLTPRSFAVLRLLVEHPGRLVTKDDLLATVWRDAIVSDAALASCIRDLRKALGDSSGDPRYIQTVHRRGFRFIGPIAVALSPAAPGREAAGPRMPDPFGAKTAALVGREAALGRLHAALERAVDGQRQLVFVSGEAGIGKTALVEAFVAGLDGRDALRVGRGQCVEHYGAGEPYLPVLEALGRLGRAEGGEAIVRILMRQAPTWLAELPGLLSDADLEVAQRRAQGATRERMLREMVDALDALTRDVVLVLVLEDLHWSDSATIDLLAMLARRPEPAHLLVLATYRPVEIAATTQALRWMKHELQMHGRCDEVLLEYLDVAAVDEYLSRRFPGHGFPAELTRVLHRNTGGNPLFLVNTMDYLVGRGQLREVDGRWMLAAGVEAIAPAVPDTLSQLIEKQLEALAPDEQTLLAVASVAGMEFSAAVAVAGGFDLRQGESQYEALARRGQFIRAAGTAEWPDGTVAARYAFIHTLYQQLLYARVSAGRRAELHLRTGEWLESGYGERAGEIAGELAMHFEVGRDFPRAARYRQQAGEHALRQHAYREAGDHATRALDLLAAAPGTAERDERELTLQVLLGAALTATRGYAAPDVARTYARARELCERADDTVRLLPVLLGLGRFHQGRGELAIARDIGTRLLGIAHATEDRAVGLAAQNALGIMAFYGGEFAAALEHLEQARALYDPERHCPNRSVIFRAGQDPGVSCAVYAAWALQLLGRPAQAAARMRDALALARSLEHPFSAAYACHFAAGFHLHRREPDAVQALEDEALAHSTEHGFRVFSMMGAIHRGWLLAQRAHGKEGLLQMREGLAASRAIGIELRRPGLLALVAEVCEQLDERAEGLAAVAEALAAAEQTGQRYWDAELHRLRGTLMLGAAPRSAESSLRQAIETARRQGARSLELRAATSLGRLWVSRKKRRAAHVLLSECYRSFTEGVDTADLLDASRLLQELRGR
jgi:predicted ATPase/DNA-binding winged helix-turn-helix (wHTH) protein